MMAPCGPECPGKAGNPLHQTQCASHPTRERSAAWILLASENHLWQAWDMPCCVLRGVCLAKAQAYCPVPAHQLKFLKFGAAVVSKYRVEFDLMTPRCWLHTLMRHAQERHGERWRRNTIPEWSYKSVLEYKYSPTLVAESRFTCRREMVKCQIKVAIAFTYCNWCRVVLGIPIHTFFFFPDCLFTVGIFRYTFF